MLLWLACEQRVEHGAAVAQIGLQYRGLGGIDHFQVGIAVLSVDEIDKAVGLRVG